MMLELSLAGHAEGNKAEQKGSLVKATAGKQVWWFFFLCPSVLFPFYTLLFKSGEIPRLRVWEWTEAGDKARTV